MFDDETYEITQTAPDEIRIRPIRPNPGIAVLCILLGTLLATVLPVIVWKSIFKEAGTVPELPFLALVCYGAPVFFIVRSAYKELKTKPNPTKPMELFPAAYMSGTLLFWIVAVIVTRTGVIPGMYDPHTSLFLLIIAVGFISLIAGVLPGLIAVITYSPIYLFGRRKR